MKNRLVIVKRWLEKKLWRHSKSVDIVLERCCYQPIQRIKKKQKDKQKDNPEQKRFQH